MTSGFAIGIALGLVVSIPPGPNTALCINLACGGTRRALPLITGAALTDALYSLLAASGILIASQASAQLFTWLAPCFLLGTAVLAWFPESLSGKVSVSVAVLNPATAAIWLSLSSLPVLHTGSLGDAVLRTLPVALGTAAWFTLLAVAAARLSLRLGRRHTAFAQKLLAVLLGVAALFSLTALVA